MVVWLAPDIPEIVPRLIGSLEHRAWDYCFRHFLQTVALKRVPSTTTPRNPNDNITARALSQSCRALPRPRLGSWNSRRFSLRSLAGSYATAPVGDKRKAFCVAEADAYPTLLGGRLSEPSLLPKPSVNGSFPHRGSADIAQKAPQNRNFCADQTSLWDCPQGGKNQRCAAQ